jgi:hypothetical protein
MVRYRIVMLALDPDPLKTEGIPCLVREQGEYSWDGNINFGSRQIITENVSEFKVYLSVNGGKSWAGLDTAPGGTGFEAGWNGNGGIRGLVDKQLETAGRPDFKSTRVSEHWFRDIPTLVRVDLTTRTATKREEFATQQGEPPEAHKRVYKEFKQSLIFVPRHSGLPMR